mmetsp:Transcript_4357/g.18428  ORF Transcript_4357/g.18428 Transcript_4357/m.18428 type:complete len:258 (+) Transcript_4357:1432-2205(+)
MLRRAGGCGCAASEEPHPGGLGGGRQRHRVGRRVVAAVRRCSRVAAVRDSQGAGRAPPAGPVPGVRPAAAGRCARAAERVARGADGLEPQLGGPGRHPAVGPADGGGTAFVRAGVHRGACGRVHARRRGGELGGGGRAAARLDGPVAGLEPVGPAHVRGGRGADAGGGHARGGGAGRGGVLRPRLGSGAGQRHLVAERLKRASSEGAGSAGQRLLHAGAHRDGDEVDRGSGGVASSGDADGRRRGAVRPEDDADGDG